MRSRLHFYQLCGLLTVLALLLSTNGVPLRAQGMPPAVKRDLVEANSGPTADNPAQSSAFQQQAEEVLQDYLEWFGARSSVDQVTVSSTSRDPASAWATYTDPYWAFKLNYPLDWQLQNLPYRDFGFRLTSPDVEVDPLGRPLRGVLLSVVVTSSSKQPDNELRLPDREIIRERPVDHASVHGTELVGLDADGQAFVEHRLVAYDYLYRFRLILARSFDTADFAAGLQVLSGLIVTDAPRDYPPPDYAAMGIHLANFDFPAIKHAFQNGPGRIIGGYETWSHTGGDEYAFDLCEGSNCTAGAVGHYIIAPTNLKLIYSGKGDGMPDTSKDYHIFEIANDGSNRLCMSLAHFQILLPGFTVGKRVPRGAAIGALIDYTPSSPHIHMGVWTVPATGGCAGGNRTGVAYAGAYQLDGIEYPIGPNHSGTSVTSTNYPMCAQPTDRADASGSASPNGPGDCFPAPPCPQSGGVILYRNANYDCGGLDAGSGYAQYTTTGWYNLPGGLNDQASSIRILAGWSVKLFEHADQGGGQTCINAEGDSDFVDNSFNNGLGVNDKVSSAMIYSSLNCTSFTPDTTPPSGDYTSPANGSTVGRTAQLSAWASDNAGGSGVREVHFTAKWNNQWQLVYNDTAAPYEFTWDLCASGVPDGDIELGLDVYDNANNEFHVSNVHPNLHITKSYNCSPQTVNWSADYWMNKYLAGYVNLHRDESGMYIFRDWGDGGPGDPIPVNEWSARYTRSLYFPGGEYRFHCQHDDGCRIFIDGQERVNGWWDSSFDGHDWGGYVSPGNHEIKVEYYENQGGARLEAWWQGPGFLPRDDNCVSDQWCAEYWGNRNLSGTPAIRRNEGNLLDHDWGSGGPDPTFPTDGFSSRFAPNANFTCGAYRFNLFGDDGVRFRIDNTQYIDQWHDQATWYTFDVNMPVGSHALRVEHYENGGGAGVKLNWSKLSDCPLSLSLDAVSQHFVKSDQTFDPLVRIRVNSSYLDPSRGDHLYNISGGAFGAWPVQAVKAYVPEGSSYTFDVANDSGFRMTAPATEGTYTSRWQMKVGGNLIGPEAALQITVDNTAPGITIASPGPDAFLNANAVTIQANPQDNTSGIDQVQFFAGYDDGTGWAWHNLGWDVNGADGWSKTWDAALVPDQAGVAVYAYAWDKAGNGAGVANWGLMLDRAAPTTSLLALAAQQNSTAFVVWWDRADNLSGIDHVDLQVQQDGGAWQDWATVTGEEYVGKWFYGELGHAYAFRMRGVDRAGNVEAYPSSAETSTLINPCLGDAYEPDSSASAARAINVDAPAETHTFCGAGDEDWLKFWAEAGHTYLLHTSQLGETTDTVLTLLAADGATVIAENDDIDLGVNLASWLTWTAPTPGWRYVRVRDWDARVAGSAVTYAVQVQTGHEAYLPLVTR